MKKNIIKVAFVAAFAIVAGYNVYSSQKTDMMSDLAFENVEALAGGEGIVQFDYYCAGSGYCSIDGEAWEGTKYKF